jgi:succinate dehydrogenase / fumarate reductase cytochrome b subunit
MLFQVSKDKRPVFLNPTKLYFPITALISILHRITGLVMLVALLALMYVLQLICMSPDAFASWQLLLQEYWLVKALLILVLSALLYHVCAGIRHMLHDFSCLEHSVAAARRSAFFVIPVVLGLLLVTMIRLW